uniref:MIF4G domain-containing protein n=1 Tax=Trypanosoma congolense (strain IL3000) TaxID=1068625 RepID=G0US44_TRYCI|nr:conserved hypothetical protein [Trypanosoma congolense IL3000]
MEHRTGRTIPARMASAPLTQSSSFQNSAARTMNNYRPVPNRAAGERPSPLQHTAASSSVGILDRASQSAAGAAECAASSYPENCVYELSDFIKLQHTKVSPPKAVLQFAVELWKEMPENVAAKPDHILSREELFQGESAPSKVMSERKLHNEVLGILGKVSSNNIELMKKELTDLPIRQSDDEEIEEVIRVIFHKSIQPEDSIFVQLYVKLIAHLISSIGDNEPAGRYIRSAIIRQSQNMFEKAEGAQERLEREISSLPGDEAEQRRMSFAAKQKANINFLGLLFTHGLVREKVVLQILEWLLYGPERRRRIPADYEIIHFMNLLLTCGKDFSKEGKELVPRFRSVLEELMHTHPQRRIQFLLLNTLETIDNNWVPRHGANAAPARSAQDNTGGSAGAGEDEPERRPPPPMPLPLKPVPSREKFWTVIDKFFTTGSVEDVSLLLADIPEEARIAYCSSVIQRYITTMRYADRRARLGELFEKLEKADVLPGELVRRALFMHLRHAVEQDIFAELPKYFQNWAAVIKGGREVFTPTLHTEFLNMLVDCGSSRENIVNMVKSVHAVLSEEPITTDADYDPRSRFRVLPALLRYTPPVLSDSVMDESDDIVRQLTEHDVEVGFFFHMCEADGLRNIRIPHVVEQWTQRHELCLLSAIFTFVRFDVEFLCRECKDMIRKLNGEHPVQTLEEVYVTWQSLDRTPEDSFVEFCKVILGICGTKDPLTKLKERLSSYHGSAGKEDVAILDKLKN